MTRGWNELLELADGALKAHFSRLLETGPKVAASSVLTGLLERYGGVARFEIRDSIVFPITFGTQVGEFNEVDVMR